MMIVVVSLIMGSFSIFLGEAVVGFFTSVGLKHFSCKYLIYWHANPETKTSLELDNSLVLK